MSLHRLNQVPRIALWVVALICSIRLVNVFVMGLMPQDAYYCFYAQHPAMGYFDHPPGIAWLIRVMISIFGKNEWVLKFGDFLLTALMLLLFYRLGMQIIGKARTRSALLLLISSFLVTILSCVSTPDVPLMFFWCASLLLFYHCVTKTGFLNWLLAGFAMGLAFNCKYTAVFLPLGSIFFLIASSKHRKYLFQAELLGLLFTFFLTVLPVLYWNYQHDWVSIGFQSADRLESILQLRIRPHLALGMIGHQMFILLPVFIIVLYLAIGKLILKLLRNHFPSQKVLFMMSFSVPIILAFALISPIYWVKLNWVMPGYLSGALLAGLYVRQRWVYFQLYLSLIIHVLLLVQVLIYPINIKSDDTWWGWEELAYEVELLHQRYPEDFIFSADGYKTSSILTFYLDSLDIYAGNLIGETGFQFEIIHDDFSPLLGRNGLFIDSNRSLLEDRDVSTKQIKKLRRYFREVKLLMPIDIRSGAGQLLRQFNVYRCVGYRDKAQKSRTRTSL